MADVTRVRRRKKLAQTSFRRLIYYVVHVSRHSFSAKIRSDGDLRGGGRCHRHRPFYSHRPDGREIIGTRERRNLRRKIRP